MKDTAPKGLGIIAVSAIFGIIAAGVAFVMWDFGWIGAAFIGILLAALVMIVLMLGWREPNPSRMTAPDTDHKAKTPGPDVASAPMPAAAPAAAAPAAAAASTAPAAKPAPAPKPAAKPTPAPAAAAPAPAKPAAAPAPAAAATGPGSKPPTLTAARAEGPDDLKQIKGVGPKLEKMLHDMGFYHFDQIAAWGADEVAWVDQNLQGFKGRVSRDDWVPQAKTLAAGGTTEFSSKVKKGGVY